MNSYLQSNSFEFLSGFELPPALAGGKKCHWFFVLAGMPSIEKRRLRQNGLMVIRKLVCGDTIHGGDEGSRLHPRYSYRDSNSW